MRKLPWVLGGALVLGGCAAAPVHFHTLYAAGASSSMAGEQAPEGGVVSLPSASRSRSAGMNANGRSAAVGHPMRFEVHVTVPERLNRNNIVLHGAAPAASRAGRSLSVTDESAANSAANTALQVLDNERWEAVFGDALQDALAAHLARETAPVAVAPMRLDVKVYRFDAMRSGSVDVLLDWTLHRRDVPAGEDDADDRKVPHSLSCRHVAQPVVEGGDVGAAVQAMQQAVAQLASGVARGARLWLKEGKPRCVGMDQESLTLKEGVTSLQHGG